MPVKVTVKDFDRTPPFPLIKKHVCSNVVVLFTSKGVGTVIVPDGSNHLGEFRQNWVDNNFVIYDKAITLVNE